MEKLTKDMIGTRQPRVYPSITIAGYSYRIEERITCNLDDKHIVVLDNRLSASERDERLEALLAMVNKPKRKGKSESGDNESA